MGQTGRLHDLVESVLSSSDTSDISDLELVDIQIGGGLVRVTVDRPDGVDLDLLSETSRAISAALDREDLVPGGRYTLEITSPGVERPLRTPEHFQRFIGTGVNVKTRPGTDGDRRLAGTLVDADGAGIVIVGSGLPEEGRRLAYSDIEKARTTFEWGQPGAGRDARHGSRRHAPRKSPPSSKKATT